MLINDFKPYRKTDSALFDSLVYWSRAEYRITGRIYSRAEQTWPKYPDLGNRLHVYDDGIGQWYLFGGYCEPFALVRADCFDCAYDIYLSEYITPDDELPIDDDEYGAGYITSDGKWYSEAATSLIVDLPLADFVLCLEITPPSK